MKANDTYKEIRTIKLGENIARVYIPNLTDEERERRILEIAKAASEMLAKPRFKK